MRLFVACSSGLLVLTGGVCARAFAGAPNECPSGVVLTGTAAIVEEVGARLEARGLATQAAPVDAVAQPRAVGSPACPRATATLLLRENSISVELTQSDGSVARREVSDASTAASLVEAWVNHALWGAALKPAWSEVAEAPTAARDSAPLLDVSVAPEPPSFVLSGRLGVAYGGDETLWTSAVVSGCGRLGPVCLGFQVRGAFDPGISGESDDTRAQRGGIDGLATLDLPVTAGAITLRPGIGVGAEWVRTVRRADSQQEGESQIQGGELVSVDAAGMRLAASFRIEVPLSTSVAFDGGVSIETSPVGDTDRSTESGVELPGTTRWQLGPSVGLQFGVP